MFNFTWPICWKDGDRKNFDQGTPERASDLWFLFWPRRGTARHGMAHGEECVYSELEIITLFLFRSTNPFCYKHLTFL